MPAATDPWFSASAPAEWYPVAAGATVTIPLTGFSAAATADWSVRASGSDATWKVVIDGPTHESLSPRATPTINNGRNATLTVTAAMNAASGANRVIYVESFRSTATGEPAQDVDKDILHFWPVGVYVK